MGASHEASSPSPAGAQGTDQLAAPKCYVLEQFRTEVRTVSEAELEALNEKEGRTGARRYERADIVLGQIARNESPSQEQLDSWVTHPDERVPIALLQSEILRPYTDEARPYAVRLCRRAIREAGDYFWTPLLDALSLSGYWSRWTLQSPRENVVGDQPAFDEGTQDLFEEEYFLQRITRWIEAQSDTAPLIAMARSFHALSLLRQIATHARVLDVPLVDQLIAQAPEVLEALASRHQGLLRGVGRRIVEHLVRMAQGLEVDGANMEQFELNLMLYLIRDSYKAIQKRGHLLTEAQIDALVRSSRARVQRATHENTNDPGDWPSASLFLLLAYVMETKSEEVALQYIEAAAEMNDPWYVSTFLIEIDPSYRSNFVTPAMGRATLKWFGHDIDVCEALVLHAGVRNDPEVRVELAKSDSSSVIASLLEEAPPEEFAHLFRRLAAMDQQRAAAVLKKARRAAKATLDPSDLLPLLRAEDRDVRMQAVMLLSKLEKRRASTRKQGDRVSRGP